MGKSANTKCSLIVFSLALIMAAVVFGSAFSHVALADDDPSKSPVVLSLGDGNKPDPTIRTIMIYLDGASSEANNPVCSAMLEEYVNAKFNRSDFRIIVMTGGSNKWHLDSKYLKDEKGGTIDAISNEYNQVWEVHGAVGENPGYLELLDGDGVTGDGDNARMSKDELMSDPNTLKGFINYAKETAPGAKYDLILNDHGAGPGRGYGCDDHNTDDPSVMMSVADLRSAIAGSDVCAQGGKFDFIELDCCMMGSFEVVIALSDYTDYYLGSPDVDPGPTVDYKALFDYLGANPGVGTKDLGKKLVDLFVEYYEKNPDDVSVGNSVQFCMVDIQALKKSGIVAQLQKIANELRAQATAGSFYDEIRAGKDDYRFAYPNLQDFGTLAEQIGISIYETDWTDPKLANAYTEAALKIQNTLYDKDIVYSKYTNVSKKAAVLFGRENNGDLTVRDASAPESGLSIFGISNLCTGSVAYEMAHYVDAMPELVEALKDDGVKTLYSTYLQAVIDYGLIYASGYAVSSLVDSGCAMEEIDYDKVIEYIESTENENSKGCFSKILEVSDRDVKAWLSQIIDTQKKEAFNHEKVSLETETVDGTENYRINVADTPKRVIDVPVLRVTAKMDNGGFPNPTMVLYGAAAFSGDDEQSFEDYMASDDSSYLIPKYDGQWYAVKDASGETHVASAASDHSVFALFIINGAKPKEGELQFDDDGKAKYAYVYGNTIPYDLASFDGAMLVMMCNDPNGKDAVATSMPFEIDGENTRLIKDTYSNLGIEGVELKLAISDMYGVEHEVKPELAFDPNFGTWTEGGNDVKKFEVGLETDFEIIAAPKRDGYTFVCWEGSEYQPKQQYHTDSDHTFTAKWKKNEEGDSGGSGDSSSDGKDNPERLSHKSTSSSKQSSNASGNSTKTGSAATAKTGDPVNPALWFALLISAGTLAFVARKLRRS